MDAAVLTVLIVDDEDAVRESFCDYFDDYGFRSLPVDSGEAALALLTAESPDAAIVDIRMGGMTGDEFIRKAYQQRPQCAFIICTGSPEYDLPEDLHPLCRISPMVFKKPVADLDLLQQEVARMVARIRREDVSDE